MKAPQKLQTTALTQSAMKAYYETARGARSRGRKVAWSTVMMPTEILLAADIDVVFPETTQLRAELRVSVQSCAN